MNPIRALILGAPGAGKGTQTARVLQDFSQFKAVSSGDLLRANVAQRTALGLQSAAIIKQGGLVPDETMVELVRTELVDRGWLTPVASWILDGFPRTAAQAQRLDAFLDRERLPLNLVVQLDVPEQVILRRIEDRWVHGPSGRVYNLSYNPPKRAGFDNETGEPLTKRPDDNVEVFKQRLDAYHCQTMPLVEHYAQKKVLYTIEGDTSDAIYPQLKELLQKLGA